MPANHDRATIDKATTAAAIRQQYARWPYPRVALLATIDSTHPWQLHCDWLWDRAGSGQAPARPRIWIAGCGTFQPYVFACANPAAEIVATDVSEPSLRVAQRRCRLHRARNVAFAACDLDDPATWPEGSFDLIECYGVLMNLRDPAAALRRLGERLAPGGVLRLMVYPWFSRARIFQLQRLALLCGFHAGDRTHPRAFRALARALPRSHPLRHAFTGYADSRNDEGVVDAFLHAGDRGFTGWQLGAAIAAAGLEPAFWFHAPHAQPAVMAERLQLGGRSADFVLGYLDLWQELRQNPVVCLRRAGATARRGPERSHPSFAGTGPLRHALRLLRLWLCGGRLPTRTGDGDVVLRAQDARALAGAVAAMDPAVRARLREHGLLLGGDDAHRGATLPPPQPFAGEAAWLAATRALRVGRRAPNPLFQHLFAAFEFDRRCPGLALPDLDGQLGRWLPWATPLEDRRVPFGLTPYATCLRFRRAIADHLAREPLPTAAGWRDVRLRADAERLRAARAFAAAHGAPADLRDDAAARELWHLVFAHDDLFLTLLPA
jgi:SAM-dependent methyltransferase